MEIIQPRGIDHESNDITYFQPHGTVVRLNLVNDAMSLIHVVVVSLRRKIREVLQPIQHHCHIKK